MVVIKRDGREADFDKGKIANAILKAFTEVEKLSAVGDKNEVPRKSPPVCITAISGATVRFLLRKSRTTLKLS